MLTIYYIRCCNKFLIDLPLQTQIDSGLQFPHNGPIIINPKCKIGENCIIHPCTLLGGDRKTGAPIIGNNVFIGNGSKLIGQILIGNNVFIAPGAIITKNIPDDYIVGSGLNNILKTEDGGIEVKNYSSKLSGN